MQILTNEDINDLLIILKRDNEMLRNLSNYRTDDGMFVYISIIWRRVELHRNNRVLEKLLMLQQEYRVEEIV